MRKIPTLFIRDETRHYVTHTVTPGCEWVLAGEGVATRKWDGTCVMIDADNTVWARREVKPGKDWPPNYRAIETDYATGKTVGWEPAHQSGYASVIATALLDSVIDFDPGTYELVGPKINGNPDEFSSNTLARHGARRIVDLADRSYEGIRDWLAANKPAEGIVFWQIPDSQAGALAKIKRRDFPELGAR